MQVNARRRAVALEEFSAQVLLAYGLSTFQWKTGTSKDQAHAEDSRNRNIPLLARLGLKEKVRVSFCQPLTLSLRRVPCYKLGRKSRQEIEGLTFMLDF